MITPRSKMRLDEPAPVLFRLPNLRTRGSRPKASASVVAVAPNETSFKTDDNRHTAQPPSGTKSPRIERQFDFVETNSPDRAAAVQSPKASGDAVSAPANAASSVTEMGPIVSPLVSDPAGRSWMEQVGSRVILVVTLLIIVSAAWVTGARMPASTPGNMSDAQVAHTRDLNTQLPEISNGELQTESVDESKAGSESMLAGSDKISTKLEASPHVDLAAPENRSLDRSLERDFSDAASGISTIDNITQLLPPDGREPVPTASSEDLKSNIANLDQAVSLKPPSRPEPPVSLEPPTSLDSSFYTAEEPSLSNSVPVSNVSIQTRTPVAPSIDPEVMVPWANENTAMRTHQPSATPNPIRDWSQYLPSVIPSSNVRTTSATQSSSEPMAEQAIYQPSSTVESMITQ